MRLTTTRAAAVAAAVVLALAGSASAEEKHGVVVYPGAKYDSGTSDAVTKMLKADAGCYRTGDDVAKVAGFYRQQEGVKAIGDVTAQGAMFRKGEVDVTIQRPWMDMKTGKMNDDTLVSIVKQK